MIDHDYVKFTENVKRLLGIDLGLYKETQMNRRLRALFTKRGYKNYDEYFKAISQNKELREEFLDRMTINVTEFFRNPVRWEEIEKDIFSLYRTKKERIRCWSAACSTGEEAYTMGMLLSDMLSPYQFDILATDIDDLVLEKAKEGIYHSNLLKSCPTQYVNRYFTKQDDGQYAISDDIKRKVQFKKHNLLHDSFERGFDLIVCRNVMIYFTEEAKHELYLKFNQALKPGGILFVGSTEQIFYPEKYNFEMYKPFFYIKKS